jgi:hypothetical protein
MKLEPHQQAILDQAVQAGLLDNEGIAKLPTPMLLGFLNRLAAFRAIILADVRVGAYEFNVNKRGNPA